MPSATKQLGGVALAATTLTPVYTVPSGNQTVLSSVSICNRGSTQTTFRLSHAVAGAADASGQYLYYDAPIAANSTVILTSGLCLGPTDVLRAYGGNANLTVVAWGQEGTPPLDSTVPLPLALNLGGTGADTAPVARTNLGLGTMSTQNANAVAITDGRISLGGHAPTGVLDVQGSMQASDSATNYYGVRVWPVAPSGSVTTVALRIEAATGAGLAGNNLRGIVVVDQPSVTNLMGASFQVSAGTNRYNIYAQGTAPNYFAGNVGIKRTPTVHACEIAYVGASQSALVFYPDSNATTAVIFTNATQTTVGSITTSSTATAYNTSSDARLKHRIETLVGALGVVQLLNPVRFLWNADNSPGVGFRADELQQVIPEAVTGEPDAVNEDGSILPQGVDLSKIVPYLVGAIQALTERVIALEAR